MSDFEQRFGGIARLYGRETLELLRHSHIAIVGIGGVGSWAAEAAARSGFGTLTLIDLDDIDVGNTNRQIHARDGHFGRPKVTVMAERIRSINPECDCRVIEDFVAETNQERYLAEMDVVIDAIDSVRAKAAMLAFCRRRKIPVVMAGGAGGKCDPTQIQVADLNRTTQDPLAAKVRSRLRRFHHFSRNPKRSYGIPCVYSTEQPKYPAQDGAVCQQKPDDHGRTRLDCATGFGATTVVTASFGFVAIATAIERLQRRMRQSS